MPRPIHATVASATLALLALAMPRLAHGYCHMTVETGQACCDPAFTTCTFLRLQRPCFTLHLDGLGARQISRPEVLASLRAAVSAWTDQRCGAATSTFDVRVSDEISRCQFPEYNQTGGNANAVTFVSNWDIRDHSSLALGVTTVWSRPSTGEILDTDLEVNEDDHLFDRCPSGGCDGGAFDLDTLLVHEVGHMFGMGHSPDGNAAMFASRTGIKRALNADDIAGFCDAYPSGAITAECDFEPVGGFVSECGGDGCGCGGQVREEPTPVRSLFWPGLVGSILWSRGRRRRKR